MVDPDRHPPLVGGDVVDAVGDGLPEFFVLEVVHPHELGLALWSPLPACVLEIADQLFLLGVHADHRLVVSDRAFGDRVDVPELRVTVRVLPALPRLEVRLQAVPQPAQKLRDRRVVRLVAELAQSVGEMPDALGRPAQKRPRIPPAISFDQPLEIQNQRRIRFGQPLASTTRPPHPPRREPLAPLKLIDPLPDRRHRYPGRARRRCNPTPTSRTRLTGRPQPPLPLVQLTRQRPELIPDRNLIRHTPIVPRPNTQPCNIIYLQTLNQHTASSTQGHSPSCARASQRGA